MGITVNELWCFMKMTEQFMTKEEFCRVVHLFHWKIFRKFDYRLLSWKNYLISIWKFRIRKVNFIRKRIFTLLYAKKYSQKQKMLTRRNYLILYLIWLIRRREIPLIETLKWHHPTIYKLGKCTHDAYIHLTSV